MEKLGKDIYTNAWDYKVYAVMMKDISSSRVSLELYVVSPDGGMSDIVTLPRKDFLTKKNCLDFFLEMDGDFKRDDIDTIRVKVMEVLKEKMETETVQKRATMEELHEAVSRFLKDNAEELEDNPEAEVFIKDGYGYMLTRKIADFIKDSENLGFKRQEVLKRLKIMGALKNGKSRPYDMLASINGEKRRYYKILLASENKDGKEEECEVIHVAD